MSLQHTISCISALQFILVSGPESERANFLARTCNRGHLLILEANYLHSDGIPLRARRTEGSSVFGGARRREKCTWLPAESSRRGPKTGQRARCNRNHTCCSLNASLCGCREAVHIFIVLSARNSRNKHLTSSRICALVCLLCERERHRELFARRRDRGCTWVGTKKCM